MIGRNPFDRNSLDSFQSFPPDFQSEEFCSDVRRIRGLSGRVRVHVGRVHDHDCSIELPLNRIWVLICYIWVPICHIWVHLSRI